MNYVSHMALARQVRDQPAFILGSMLPDLVSICRGHLRRLEHPDLAAGEAHHQEADFLFHCHPLFIELCAEGAAALTTAGLPRPASRGAAHVGVELLLDSYLLEVDGLETTFREALALGAPEVLGGALDWRREEDASAFEQVRVHMHRRGLPHGYLDDSFVGACIARAMSRRPRLALEDDDRGRVVAWVGEARSQVRARAGELMEALARMLVPVSRSNPDR